ncbi:hypothetical protein [Actinomadura parmotrematis]|uniref:SPOR domain-containing protein n=1 Tax=Actinomadura parmotrematis TaxID=2864039 RepID=A0ABS7G5W8_9ACTN|nr:hypothetical protein [Actinomadura parmotrematis]MBW8487269.1 hypothetical protein [Actinomadura parmotrematis]
MNSTEARLADALRAAGDTIGPADVADPTLTPGGARRRWKAPVALLSAAAAAAVIAGGTLLGPAGHDARPAAGGSSPTPSATPAAEVRVSIVLCGRKSTVPRCRRSPATENDRKRLLNELQTFAYVRSIDAKADYEIAPKKGSNLIWARVATQDDAQRLARALLGRPGVESVVVYR